MFSIKDLSLVYELPAAKGCFSEGDDIMGTFTFEVKKETKVRSIFIKAKGEASVSWTEKNGDNSRSYSAKERFFKIKVYITPQNSTVTVIPKGIHRHNFTIQIPQMMNLPSSIKAEHGKIVYLLEAKITRSWRMDCKAQTEFNFSSRFISNLNLLMCLQVGLVDKKVGGFSKGQVQMSATVERGVYAPGETVVVITNVNNSSTKKVKPKYTLKKIVVYRVKSHTRSSSTVLMRAAGDVIEPNSQKRVICSMQIPADMAPSIGKCQILSVEYVLKVHLDIKFAFDPEIRFPLVVSPGLIAAHQSGGAVGPYLPGHQENGLFPPPSAFPAPYPACSGPGLLPHQQQQKPLYPPAFPGQAAGPQPQPVHPFPAAYPYALPQAAPMGAPHLQEPPPYTP